MTAVICQRVTSQAGGIILSMNNTSKYVWIVAEAVDFSLVQRGFTVNLLRAADRTGAVYARKQQQGRFLMGKRDDLIAKYADDLKAKCGMSPDMDLLTKVTIGCGPAIYNADASTVASSQPAEIATVKNNFLIKKLGLKDSPDLDAAIDKVLETYGKSERNKYRAVVYYMLTKHFGKEAVYS